MQSTITRRAALTGTAAGAAAIVAGSGTALANEHPDAELLELGRAFDPIAAEMAEASRWYSAAYDYYDANTPARPDALKIRPGDRDLGIRERFYKGSRTAPDHYGDRDIDFLRKHPPRREVQVPIKPGAGGRFAPGEPIGEFPRDHELLIASEPWPEAEARANEIVAADDAHRAACEELRNACGVRDCEEELKAVDGRLTPLRDAILEAEATTIAGMSVKVRVSLSHMGCDLETWMNDLARGADLDSEAINSIIWDIMQESEA